MVATIKIIKTVGSAGYENEYEQTSIGLKSVDDQESGQGGTAPADAPVNIPAAGSEYSYESWIRFECTVAPDNECTNFKIWDDGVSMDTGVDITVNTDVVNSYATPVDTQSAKGTRDSLGNHGAGAKINVSGSLTGSGDKTDFSVVQLEVINTASPGDITNKTVNFSYDEN